MIAQQIHEHSEWVTANHFSISHLTDGRTDDNTDRNLEYLRFAMSFCERYLLSVWQSVGSKGRIYHCLFVRHLAECYMDWSMNGGSCVRILRQSHVLCYQMLKQVDLGLDLWMANGHLLVSIWSEARSGCSCFPLSSCCHLTLSNCRILIVLG